VSPDVNANSPSTAPAGDRSQRSPRNLIIERDFQMKYVYFIVLLTIAISVPLGVLLHREAISAVQMGTEANAAATEAVAQARMLNTKLLFDAKVAANGNEAKVAAAATENEAATKEIEERARKLEAQQEALKAQQGTVGVTLSLALGALVVLVGLLAVFFTHKVAGPIHRMRALFREVGDGQFLPVASLRKGDDLQEFFSDFTRMVAKLRDRQKSELERLDKAIKRAEDSGAAPESVQDLQASRKAMRAALGQSMPPPPPDEKA
jgi:predicted hotdog family 3-hydroxylacyl-ACP dehydratase